MTVNEQNISYKISNGKFFEHKKTVTDWKEAKKLIKETIANNKKKTANLEIYHNDDIVGAICITDASALEEPKFETGLSYDELIKKAIDTEACAFSNDDIAVFVIDRNQARASGSVRRCNRAKMRAGNVVSCVLYASESEAKSVMERASGNNQISKETKQGSIKNSDNYYYDGL